MSNQNPHNFSVETMKWLGNWLSGGADASKVPEVVITELDDPGFKPRTQTVTLYRGLRPEDIREDNALISPGFSSWSYNKEMAGNFSKTIVSAAVCRDRILVDTTKLDPRFIILECSGFPDEEEVVLRPGKYRVEDVQNRTNAS